MDNAVTSAIVLATSFMRHFANPPRPIYQRESVEKDRAAANERFMKDYFDPVEPRYNYEASFRRRLRMSSSFAFTRSAPKLDTNELKTLKVIWEKMGLGAEWDFDNDPCSGEGKWSSFLCDCNFETCSVTNIDLEKENISGDIPLEFANLPHLEYLDLSNNYLKGSVPSEWATMRLISLSLGGNWLSGPFPMALTRIIKLEELLMEGNQFYGPIPKEIAYLRNLKSLALSSNYFTGPLPVTLAKLTNLTEMAISGNNFTGRIPNFISRWTKLKKLYIQGCSFKGPIPNGISGLTQLTHLIISDLIGGASTFPRLQNMARLSHLVLRNCFIHGSIPDYIGKYMINLEALDISNNHFTWDASGPSNCNQGSINVVESYSSSSKNIQKNIHPCLQKDFPCTKPLAQQKSSLYINCGGRDVLINNTFNYKADRAIHVAFFWEDGEWASSNTGNFVDAFDDSYILSNTSQLHNIPTSYTKLYTTARATPISTTYYGLCLMKGSYNVTLHFAEIAFTDDDKLFNSFGKRVFNVYVQGELKIKDFDIAKEAGGTGKAVIKRYMIEVTTGTIKIQLYWAGKGTTNIPVEGSYGPIISAISVEPNFKPQRFHGKNKVGLILGTVGGGVIFVFLIIVLLWRKGYTMRERITDRGTVELPIQASLRLFTKQEIIAATNNLNPSNKLGDGGFGDVYKGILSDETIVAIKLLSPKSKQGIVQFLTEIEVIARVNHPRIVRLYGSCFERNQLCLVYEYMENNCLSHALLAGNALKEKLTWSVRLKICNHIAQALVFLHESDPPIIHRDIKTSNVLLDGNLIAKLSDFGLAKLHLKTHTSTSIVGSKGYMAPEAAGRGEYSLETDVFSLGMVMLEIISGKKPGYKPSADIFCLLHWACNLKERNKLLELVDPDLGSKYSKTEALKVINLALLCTEASPNFRPKMRNIINILDGNCTQDNLLNNNDQLHVSVTTRQHFWENVGDDGLGASRDESCTDYSFPSTSGVRD
ncbi:hypothetical protein QVD17_26269 [Tagetes erecta]|uniref:non-specific serine/threonine protein kinase n=1 Tax=Tagetes erecta TaxID=13708 RepID=A0AAD8KAN0_TARER|nr:hypothetical protein QVD17_26269 [Tagetes erecta]